MVFFFQAEDGIRDYKVTGVQTCALPISAVNPANTEWPLFKDRMTEPFIGDVLEGAAEWRLLSRAPLGQLLVESFERRLFPVGGRQATMGASSQLALILNTTIAAHPQEDSDL